MSGTRVEHLDPSDPHDVLVAVELLRKDVIGASFGSVFGLIGDGLRPATAHRILQLKGSRRAGHPLSVCVPDDRFRLMIDVDRVAPELHGLLREDGELAGVFSSLCFLRAPIRTAVAEQLPEQLISVVDGVPYLQNLDPSGIPEAASLVDAMWDAGISFPAATSMNTSGRPEIVLMQDAERFCQDMEVSALVARPWNGRALGSFTILQLGQTALTAIRHGVIPVATIAEISGLPIDDSSAIPPDHPSLDIPANLLTGLSRTRQAAAALEWLSTQGTIEQARA